MMINPFLVKLRCQLGLLLWMSGLFYGGWATASPVATRVKEKAAFGLTLSFDVSKLTCFNTVAGQASGLQTFTMTAQGLPPGNSVAINPPAGYEMFVNSSTEPATAFVIFGNTTLTISMRLKAGLPLGTVNGNVRFEEFNSQSVLLQTRNVFLQGTVTATPQPPTLSLAINPATLPAFSTIQGQASVLQTFTMTASCLPTGNSVAINPPAGYEMFVNSSTEPATAFVIFGNKTLTISMRLKAGLPLGAVNGNVRFEEFNSGGSLLQTKTLSLFGNVIPPPTVTINPTSLTGFTTVEGTASAAKSFTVSVTGLPTQGTPTVTVAAPAGYSVGLSSGTLVNSFVLLANNGRISATVFARLNGNSPVGTVSGNVTLTGKEIPAKTVAVSGSITAKPPPTLTVDKSSLSFATITNKASDVQTYSLKAANLAANASATVTAPAGYELRLGASGTVFSSAVTVLSSNGTLNATVSVRLKATSTAGTVNGTLTNSVAGLSKTIPLSGKVNLPPSLTLNPTVLSGFTTVKNQPSAAKTYAFKALNLPAGTTATLTAPANYELRIQNTGNFAGSLTLSQTSTGTIDRVIEARIKATTTTGTVSGNVTHSVAGLSKTVSLTGSVNAPSLSVTSTLLSGFSTVTNQASATKTYSLTATNLASGLNATVTAPAGYEVRVQNTGSFVSTLTLTQTSANTISRTVEVRLKAQTAAATVSGTLTNTVAGLSKSISLSGTVKASLKASPAAALPGATASVTPAYLSGCITTEGRLAKTTDAQSFLLTVQGGPRLGMVHVEAPAGFLVSLSRNPSTFVKLLGLPLAYALTDSVFVRLDGSQAGAYTGTVGVTADFFTPVGVTVSGVTLPRPTLAVNPTSLSFKAYPGQPSEVQPYRVSSAHLEPGVAVQVKAPAGFEVSLTNGGAFSGTETLSLPQNLPQGVDTTVYVRMKPQPKPTSLSGVVANVTAGGLQKSVSLSGTVLFAKPLPGTSVSVPSLSGFTATASSPSPTQSYTFSGGNGKPGSTVYVSAPDGYQIRAFSGTPFASYVAVKASPSGSFFLTITVRLKPQANPGTITGTITNSAFGLTKTVEVSGTATADTAVAARAGSPMSSSSTTEQPQLLVNAYPNPVQDVLTVKVTAPEGQPVQLELTDPRGQPAYRQQFRAQGDQSLTLPLQGYRSGLYLLRVVTSGKRQTLKILKL